MTAQLTNTLLSIEAELKAIGLWAETPPSEAALASTQPFCVDTLSLPEWLQFIFLPRMRMLLDAGLALPSECGIAPIAEEFFKHAAANGQYIIALLVQVDQLLSEVEL
ncbi:YqcC family protein [Aestuariicella hydrocarbonica]|uniref:YqcC family protein n=1 Tax=Pseudomaricurvus hydrocarbonicus TaxID=1470433 RepID=A0A9E5JQN7_9GAMM|nr:YqcC family protein [Aestuariicella hydrocarbonica]NHO64932.1 YqcC family protein [Aestuariicella hydrocarbonica]